ncbi:MAG: hypothetical protein KDC06_00625 [Chitinophagaceae bacterium]|nr:hypothetical protein [Chitinophagaceae bacterium]
MRKIDFTGRFATLTTILIVCISAAVVVNGCRKTDKLVETPVNTNNNNNSVEEKFFNNHTSTEPLVKALNGFLQRTNDTLHFVEKTVSRIGYPRWDKAIIKLKNNNVTSRDASGDSVTLTYIPFVRDSENVVNASMIVETTTIDTSFQYVCDWQYSQFPYSNQVVDSTAENLALFFMYFSKLTTGQSQFYITDTLLFDSSPRMDNNEFLKITLLDSNGTYGRTTTNTNQECVVAIHCGSPEYCNAHGGCDYLNCQGPPWCYSYLYCTTFPGGDPGGGGGTGDGSGGDGGATGGGENGDGTPGDCNGNPTEGNRTAINNTCGPGWVPIEDEPIVHDEAWFNSQPDYKIDLTGLNDYPCTKTIATNVVNLNNSTIGLIQNLFSQSTKFNLNFLVDPTLNNPGNTSVIPGYYTINGTSGELAYLNVTIKISPTHLANSTKLSIAHTIIHEMIHAYFFYRSFEANGDSVKEENLANELGFLKPYDPNAPNSTYGNQHEQMAASFVTQIANALKEYKLISDSDLTNIRSLYPNLDIDTYYTALAWAGLTGDINSYITKSWKDFEATDSATAQMYKVIITAELNATPLAASKDKCQ